MPSDNQAIIRRFLEEVWNKKNIAVVDELIAPTFVMHDPMAPSLVKGIEGYKQFAHVFQTAFPDLEMRVVDIISEGESAAARWEVAGTHTGSLAGIAATGKPHNITGMNFCRIVDGKFVEAWGNWDSLGMMLQLGIVTLPAADKAA